jgi:hypothetical protein
MYSQKKLYSFLICLAVLAVISGCQFDLSGPPPLPRGNCDIQPEADFRNFQFSDNRSKYVFVLVDKSYSHTNDVLKYLSEEVLAKIKEGDRITAAFMDLEATTNSIFLNKRSELLDPPAFPPKPVSPPLTPTVEINPDWPSTTKGEKQIENDKISKDNEVILNDYYCEVAKWNIEADKLHRQWHLDQKNEMDQFLNDARNDIRLLTSTEFESGKLLYDSLYLASQMITRAKESGEFTDFALIIFSDMREWRPEKTMEINLKNVRVAVGIHTCEFAIDCDVVNRWEGEFSDFGVSDPKFVVEEDNIYRSINKFMSELP